MCISKGFAQYQKLSAVCLNVVNLTGDIPWALVTNIDFPQGTKMEIEKFEGVESKTINTHIMSAPNLKHLRIGLRPSCSYAVLL